MYFFFDNCSRISFLAFSVLTKYFPLFGANLLNISLQYQARLVWLKKVNAEFRHFEGVQTV